MTCKVVKANCEVVHGSTVCSLRTPDELMDETQKKKSERFTLSVNEKSGASFNYEHFMITDPELEDLGTPIYEPYKDSEEAGPRFVPDAEDVDEDTYDQYIGAQVLLPIGDSVLTAKVCGRKRQSDGTLRGKANLNPILDTRTYAVEFSNGQRAEVAANVIAQNMYAQCDCEGSNQPASTYSWIACSLDTIRQLIRLHNFWL